MRFLTLAEVLDLHRRLIQQTRGAGGVRELARIIHGVPKKHGSVT